MALADKFAFVTVMNVKVISPAIVFGTETGEYENYKTLANDLKAGDVLATIDSLSISNLTQEGPRKEARGGLYAKPLVRYGKTMRLEMEDVMASIEALDKLGIVNVTRYETGPKDGDIQKIEINETFPKSMMLLGETFIANEDGDREHIYILFPRFLPDGIFDLTMESEGDIGMINIHGELFPDGDDAFFVVIPKDTP